MKLLDMILEEVNKEKPESEKWVRLHSEQGEYDKLGKLHRLNGQYAKQKTTSRTDEL